MNLFSLFAKIGIDDSEFTSGLNRAESGVSSFTRSLGGVSSSVGSVSQSTSSMSRSISELGGGTDSTSIKIRELEREVQRTTRAYGTHSTQAATARKAVTDFALGLDDATFKQTYMKSQLGLTDAALQQQAGAMKLNARMTKLSGDQTQILTERMAGLQRHGIKPEDLLPPSTPGQFKILTETVNASGRGVYKLSSGFRTMGGAVEKTIKSWSMQKVVMREANGDMVKYGLLMRGATAAMGTMTMAFPVLAGAAGMFYGGLISKAIESDEKLKELADTVGNKFGKAFEPMMEIVGDVVEMFLKFAGVIADLMIKFNEAHPITAKFVQGLMLIGPAMTILLLPLSMGVGLINGWKIAINALWTIIGPFVAVIGTASSTFLVFAGVLSVVVLALTTLWMTNEKFREMVTSAWENIKSVADSVFGSLITYFTKTLPEAFSAGGIQAVFQSLVGVFTTALTNIKAKLPEFLSTGMAVITNIIGGITQALPMLLLKGYEIVNSIISSIIINVPILIASGMTIVSNLIAGITQALPQIIAKGYEIINSISNTIIAAIPNLISSGASIVINIINGITDTLPSIVEKGTDIIVKLMEGIEFIAPKLIELATFLITAWMENLARNFTFVAEKGTELLTALIDGIISILPDLIDCAVKLITTIVNTIADNLPKIIDAGLKILEALVRAIINNLPKIIDAGVKMVTSIVKAIADNLPKILEAGVKIVVELVKAIIQNLPKILESGTKVIKAFVNGAKSAISSVVSIGGDIVKGVWNGISGAAGWFYGKVSNFFSGMVDKAKGALGIHSPSRVFASEVGEWIPPGIEKGIKSKMPSLLNSINKDLNGLVANVNPSINTSASKDNKNNLGTTIYQTINTKSVLSPQEIAQETKNTFVRAKWKLA